MYVFYLLRSFNSPKFYSLKKAFPEMREPVDCRWKGLLGYSVPSGADISVLELTEALPLFCGPGQVTQPPWALISSCATRESICSLIILFLSLHGNAVFPVSCCSKMPSTQRALTHWLSERVRCSQDPLLLGSPCSETCRSCYLKVSHSCSWLGVSSHARICLAE